MLFLPLSYYFAFLREQTLKNFDWPFKCDFAVLGFLIGEIPVLAGEIELLAIPVG